MPRRVMREALSGLTLRGRAFVAGGLTAIVCAVLMGQPALTRVGVLVVALPLVTAAFIGRGRYRLALVRTVSPQVVAAGQPARVNLALANEGRTPSGVLLLEDQVPYVLGTRPRFVLEGIGQGWRRQVELPGPLRRPRPLRDRTDVGAGQRPVRAGRARAAPSAPRPADRHPAHRAAAGDPAGRRVDRVG